MNIIREDKIALRSRDHTKPCFLILSSSTYCVFRSQGAGTDDDVLIEILASRTGEQIKDIIKVYKKGDFSQLWRKRTKVEGCVLPREVSMTYSDYF